MGGIDKMARERHVKSLDIVIEPSRKDAPPAPKKLIDAAVKKAGQAAKEEIQKYYQVEGQQADVKVNGE
jgi:hypothetical protein